MHNDNPSNPSQDSEVLDSELESKLTVAARSTDRAHSTEHGDEDEVITEINVAPLVDVALVLVIIFMAVSPFMAQANLKILESRQGAASGKAQLDQNIQIMLSKEQQITIDGNTIALEDLRATLKQKLPNTKDGLVTIQADESNRVGQVVDILDIAKQSGARKVAILNQAGESLVQNNDKSQVKK